MNIPRTEIKKPNDFIKEKRAEQEAKQLVSNEPAKQPVDASKAPEATNAPKAEDNAPKKPSKRKTAEEWDKILEEMDREDLLASEVAEKHGVTESNVYQWRSKRKAKVEEAEAAKLSPDSIVEDAKKLLAGIDKELKEFDNSIEEAKAKVANAKNEREKIEAKTKKYQAIIDLFKEEAVDKK